MTISERLLKKWRLEALKSKTFNIYKGATLQAREAMKEKDEKILHMTQELLDQHMLRKVKSHE